MENKENGSIVPAYRSLEVDVNNSTINNLNSREVEVYDSNTSEVNNLNVNHSQDVVIGNVNKFHGPVTIIQNNKKKSENENNEASDQNKGKVYFKYNFI